MNKLIKKATLVAIILGTVSAANAGYRYNPVDPIGNLYGSLYSSVYGGVGYYRQEINMKTIVKMIATTVVVLSSLNASAYLQIDSDKWGMTSISDGSNFVQCYSSRSGSTTCY